MKHMKLSVLIVFLVVFGFGLSVGLIMFTHNFLKSIQQVLSSMLLMEIPLTRFLLDVSDLLISMLQNQVILGVMHREIIFKV